MVQLLRAYHLSGWRRHVRLPGKPDFTWRKERVVLFVHGCFWHGHQCGKKLSSKTNTEFWQAKIDYNRRRDSRIGRELRSLGWTVVTVWECQLARSPMKCLRKLASALGRRM